MLLREVKLTDVKDAWQRLYSSNYALTPYSSYQFNKIASRYYRFAPNRYLLRIRIFEMLDDNQTTIMIIPLYGRRNRYYLLGDLMMTGHLDFIYKQDISNEEFAQALALLQEELKGTKLILSKISERSKLNDYLALHYPILDKKICINVNFGSDFEMYIQSLSKKTRRHIRNMYNRLQRAGVNWEVAVMMNTPIENRMKSEMLRVYNSRAADKDSKNSSIMQRLGRNYTNPITISTARMEGNFNAILRIEGTMAAINCGYVTNDNSTVIVPRGAMNSKYAWFSPGMLLDLETMRWLIHNTDITNLDLSRGDEEYKYSLGGTEHYNYFYTLDF